MADIAARYNVSLGTVSGLCKRAKREGGLSRHEKSGRPRKTTERQVRAIVKQIKSDPNKSAADAVAYANEVLGIKIGIHTARRILKEHGMLARRPARKPLMLKRHCQARIEFARTYRDWTKHDWSRVLWSDESKMNLYNPDGGHLIRRPIRMRYRGRFIRPTVKYNGGGIMVWGKKRILPCSYISSFLVGCISRDFVGPLVRINNTMNAEQYRDILENHMLPVARERMAPCWLFQQDGDPKHTSQLMLGKVRRLPDGRKIRTPGWFSLNGVRLLRTPPYSPDCNPIEHVWAHVKRELRGCRFKKADDLWEAVQNIWKAIPLKKVIDIIDSMPTRLHAIRLSKGGATKY